MATQATGSSSCAYVRPTIAEAVLVILMGLTAKTALDQMFVFVPHLGGPTKVWEGVAQDLGLHILLLGQLCLLFFTSLRFYLGSLRYHQARQRQPSSKLFVLIFDMIGNTIIFVGFYLCALAIRSTMSFYLYVAGFHVFDLAWFIGACWLSMGKDLQKVMKRFIWYDIVTVGLFGVSLAVFHPNYGAPYFFQWACMAVLLFVGVVDFKQNAALYRGESFQ